MGLGSLFGSIGKGLAKPFKDVGKAVKKVGGGVNSAARAVVPGGKKKPILGNTASGVGALASKVAGAKQEMTPVEYNGPAQVRSKMGNKNFGRRLF